MTKKNEVRNKNKLKPNTRDNSHSRRGSRNRQKGHDLERYIAKLFREKLGYKFCKTSRNASKLIDDLGVDIAYGPPLSIQTKSGYVKRRPKFEELFSLYQEKLKENIPPEDVMHDFPYVLIHKLDGRKKEHFQTTMAFDDWFEFMSQALEFTQFKIELKEWINTLDPNLELPNFLEYIFKE